MLKNLAISNVVRVPGVIAIGAVLTACANSGGGRSNLLPQGPAFGPTVHNVGTFGVSPRFTCPTILVISPAVSFPGKDQHLTLSDSLQVRKNSYFGCRVVSQTHPPAAWSKTGGSIEIIRGGRQAIFSSSRFGSFTVTATFGKHTARASLVVQPNNELVLATVAGSPSGGLVADRSGALYGVTAAGGSGGGTVFRLRRGARNADTIYNFQGGTRDGSFPSGAMIADVKGDLFGTTQYGGSSRGIRGLGTVYELMPSGTGYTERVLYRFRGGTQGKEPRTGLTVGRNGALYGTTFDGKVFKLTLRGPAYVFNVLWSYKLKGFPYLSNLVISNNGSLYSAYSGSPSCCGAVFKLTPNGSSYVESTVYTFQGGTDGAWCRGLTFDSQTGVLYGTTIGSPTQFAYQHATVFDLVPSGAGFAKHTLHVFSAAVGETGGVTIGLGGQVLYGTTQSGGPAHAGTVFALARNDTAYHDLHIFESPNGGGPIGSLVEDTTGALYGVTQGIGNYGQTQGTIYEIMRNYEIAP